MGYQPDIIYGILDKLTLEEMKRLTELTWIDKKLIKRKIVEIVNAIYEEQKNKKM